MDHVRPTFIILTPPIKIQDAESRASGSQKNSGTPIAVLHHGFKDGEIIQKVSHIDHRVKPALAILKKYRYKHMTDHYFFKNIQVKHIADHFVHGSTAPTQDPGPQT
jgi:hypothetical protein